MRPGQNMGAQTSGYLSLSKRFFGILWACSPKTSWSRLLPLHEGCFLVHLLPVRTQDESVQLPNTHLVPPNTGNRVLTRTISWSPVGSTNSSSTSLVTYFLFVAFDMSAEYWLFHSARNTWFEEHSTDIAQL